MAWGYEKSFVIEHDNTLKKRIDCKDCIYYDSSDRSCMKRPLYLPVDGYNSWKTCKYFELDQTVSHYEEKNVQYLRQLEKRRKEEERKNAEKKEKQQAGVAKGKRKKASHKKKDETIKAMNGEKLIYSEWETFADDVQKNLCLLALGRRLHIYPILEECEWIIQNDSKSLNGLRKEIDKSLILIAMVLERIDYSFQEALSIPEEIEKKIIRKFFKKVLKNFILVNAVASKNEIGEDDICLKLRVYDYFTNLENQKNTRNEVSISKVLKSNYEYIYVADLYLSEVGIENKKLDGQKLKYGNANYHICIGQGDENSRTGIFFKNAYEKVDRKAIVRY